jgi:hypothetical protein
MFRKIGGDEVSRDILETSQGNVGRKMTRFGFTSGSNEGILDLVAQGNKGL